MNYINGRFVEEPFSEGILYGAGVFETIFIKDGRGEYLEEHYKRMAEGAMVLKINFQLSYSEFREHVERFIEGTPKSRYALRISVIKRGDTYDIMIGERDIPYKTEDYIHGFKVKVGSLLKNPTSPLTYIKSICYTDNLLSLGEARAEGYNEVIHLNFHGEVCEGAISNIFFVKDGVVRTPERSCGILEGIMRGRVIEELKALGIEVEEGTYSLDEILEAEEVFLTNSLMRVMPVREVWGSVKKERKIYNLLMGNL